MICVQFGGSESVVCESIKLISYGQKARQFEAYESILTSVLRLHKKTSPFFLRRKNSRTKPVDISSMRLLILSN
jgi:hypothetical protein